MDDPGPDDGQPDHGELDVVHEAAVIIAAHADIDVDEAGRALRADADAFGLSITEVAEDVVDVARAGARANPATLAQLLATVVPSRRELRRP